MGQSQMNVETVGALEPELASVTLKEAVLTLSDSGEDVVVDAGNVTLGILPGGKGRVTGRAVVTCHMVVASQRVDGRRRRLD